MGDLERGISYLQMPVEKGVFQLCATRGGGAEQIGERVATKCSDQMWGCAHKLSSIQVWIRHWVLLFGKGNDRCSWKRKKETSNYICSKTNTSLRLTLPKKSIIFIFLNLNSLHYAFLLEMCISEVYVLLHSNWFVPLRSADPRGLKWCVSCDKPWVLWNGLENLSSFLITMNITRSLKISNNSLNKIGDDPPLRTVNNANFGRISQYARLSENDDIFRGSVDGQMRLSNSSGAYYFGLRFLLIILML